MSKTTQKELLLQSDMVESLKKQGWYVVRTVDRFKAGRPDMRIAKLGYGQIDVELKYSVDPWDENALTDTGIRKLQWIKIAEMNMGGIPTVGLIYSETENVFFVSNVLREPFPPATRRVKKLPHPEIINGAEFFETAMRYIKCLSLSKRP